MASKRQATSDLNHDNWDVEEVPVHRGTFPTASEHELKLRVIKKARRKLIESKSAPQSAFSAFSGFGNMASSRGGSPFSFLSKIPVNLENAAAIKPNFSFTSLDNQNSKSTTSIATEEGDDNAVNKPKEYYRKLIDLNRAFCDWIKTCIDKDPLCYLTPVFKDYENYLKQLDQKEHGRDKLTVATTCTSSSSNMFTLTTAAATATTTTTSASITNSKPVFSFGSGSAFGSTSEKGGTKSIFGGFAAASTSAPASSSNSAEPTNGISFGKDANKASTSNFSFAPSTTSFTFGNIKPPAASVSADAEEDEDDQPPKTEFKQVLEEDAIYSKKCKVFVKKEDNFTDRGVGTLYLKPVQDSEKTQLIVRADTNLGNILVNLILSAGIPAQRMGKNNVMMVCMPTPEEQKPTSMLLRVKTAEEADELLATINKYKK